MARYNVLPAGGTSSGWKVERNSHPLSNHRTQQNAIQAAKRDGRPGDTLTIHRPDGTIRDRKTLRK
jgi:hypothetical protein